MRMRVVSYTLSIFICTSCGPIATSYNLLLTVPEPKNQVTIVTWYRSVGDCGNHGVNRTGRSTHQLAQSFLISEYQGSKRVNLTLLYYSIITPTTDTILRSNIVKSCCLNSDKVGHSHVNFLLDELGFDKMGRHQVWERGKYSCHPLIIENNFYAVTSRIKEKVRFLPFRPFEFQICSTPNEESRQQASPPLKGTFVATTEPKPRILHCTLEAWG